MQSADSSNLVVPVYPAAEPVAYPRADLGEDHEALITEPLSLHVAIVRAVGGLGITTVTIKVNLSFRVGCPFLAPASIPSPYPILVPSLYPCGLTSSTACRVPLPAVTPLSDARGHRAYTDRYEEYEQYQH